jgi:hypothetical protein
MRLETQAGVVVGMAVVQLLHTTQPAALLVAAGQQAQRVQNAVRRLGRLGLVTERVVVVAVGLVPRLFATA